MADAVIIACETLRDELEFALAGVGDAPQVVWIESGLHNVPGKLHARLQEALDSRRGLAKLKEIFAAQGGDPAVCDDVTLLPQPAVIRTVQVGRSGYVAEMDTTALGLAAQAMGAGRVQKTDALDYSVGFVLPVRIGDRVEPDTTLCTLYARSEKDADKAEAAIRAAISFSDVPVEAPPLCYAIVTKDGVERVK